MEKKPSVLVVDDEVDFVDFLVRRLQKRGVPCEGVFTGMDAVRRLKKGPVDVMLLDMHLPDMSGTDTLRALRRVGHAPRVLILSGHASARDGREGLELGASDYLLKPIEFDTLYHRLLAAGR